MKRWPRLLLPLLGLAELILLRSRLLDGTATIRLIAAIEVLLVLVALRQLIVAVRRYRRDRSSGFDPWRALGDRLSVIVPSRVARLMVLEPKLWWCVWLWLRRRRIGEDEFAYHRRAIVGPILLVALFTLPVELIVAQLLIPWAWLRMLLLIGGVYSLFWMFGFWVSLRVLPHRLEPNGVRIRFGAFAEGFVRYEEIAAVEVRRRRSPGGRDGLQVSPQHSIAYLAAGGATDVDIRLRAPRSLQGFFGPTPSVALVSLAADEPGRLVWELGQRAGVVVPTHDEAPNRGRLAQFMRAPLASTPGAG